MSTLPKMSGIALLFTAVLLPLNININADLRYAKDFNEASQESAVFNNNQNSLDLGTIIDNGLLLEIKIKGETVGEILSNAGIDIRENDFVFPSKETKFQPGTRIIIKRAMPVNLNLYGNSKEIFTQKKTVGEVLEEEKISLKENDLINVNLNDKIFPEMEIKIWEKPKPVLKRALKTPGETQIGFASWYSFIPGDFCASTIFKKGTKLRVTNLENGNQVVVVVNDYGPFTSKIIDLEKTAFAKLASPSRGVIKVKVEKVY